MESKVTHSGSVPPASTGVKHCRHGAAVARAAGILAKALQSRRYRDLSDPGPTGDAVDVVGVFRSWGPGLDMAS